MAFRFVPDMVMALMSLSASQPAEPHIFKTNFGEDGREI
jgi:hypothetical protein